MTQARAETMEFVDLKRQYAMLRADINARIQKVLDHGQFIMGPEVAEMEVTLAGIAGARHCIAVASGTDALLISLLALGLRPGDEVVTTPFTFAATIETIVLLGGRPVFVDIEPDTCNIDAAKIEAVLTSRTKAIMPVSLYGQVADMEEINSLASRHGGIPVIEDAAQSFGASYKGKRSCNLSTLGCTSFFPSKPLGCYGDGGAIFTSDDGLAQACREIRVHGQSARYRHTRIGVGGRMDTLQCAIVLGKLQRFEWEISQRKMLGARYGELIESEQLPLKVLAVRPDRDCIWAQYTVFTENREALATSLKSRGVPTAIHYPIALNRQPAYAGLFGGTPTPGADAAAARVLSLPMSPDLSIELQDRVVSAIKLSLAESQ